MSIGQRKLRWFNTRKHQSSHLARALALVELSATMCSVKSIRLQPTSVVGWEQEQTIRRPCARSTILSEQTRIACGAVMRLAGQVGTKRNPPLDLSRWRLTDSPGDARAVGGVIIYVIVKMRMHPACRPVRQPPLCLRGKIWHTAHSRPFTAHRRVTWRSPQGPAPARPPQLRYGQ